MVILCRKFKKLIFWPYDRKIKDLGLQGKVFCILITLQIMTYDVACLE